MGKENVGVGRMSGSKYERELANHLDNLGYSVIRAPASGAATTRSLPDLFWSKADENAIAAELKTRKEEPAYLSKQEINDLQEFAMAFNAQARIVLRIKQDTSFYLINPIECETTGKSIKARRENAYTTIDP